MDIGKHLCELLGKEKVSVGDSVLSHHGGDLTYHEPHRPDVVVFPESVDDVSILMKFADQEAIPVTPYGVGTSLEGHTIPLQGGICLDLSKMNRVTEIHPADFMARVEAGVTRSQLNRALRTHGLQFPLDPGADATLGGMAATNASGTTAVRYGAMRNQVLSLQVVLADGRVVETGTSAMKTSAGYNLTQLFVGSEGTLGVITGLTLRLHPVAEAVTALRAVFNSVDDAAQCAYDILAHGLTVHRLELVDQHTIAAVNRHSNTEYPAHPTLFVECQGTEDTVKSSVQTLQGLAHENGVLDISVETDERLREQLWHARHNAALAVAATAPGKKMKVTDVCVPISVLPKAIVEARRAIDEKGIYGAILGHVGDGNYHVQFMVDPNDPMEIKQANELNEEIVSFALAHGGTCTGEHGVGIGKQGSLVRQHGDLLPLYAGIKQAFDPKGIMNPGKILSVETFSRLSRQS